MNHDLAVEMSRVNEEVGIHLLFSFLSADKDKNEDLLSL